MIKTQLKSIRAQEWGALKIAIKSAKDTRQAAIENFKELYAQDKAIRAKLRTVKQLRYEKNLMIRKKREVYFMEEISTFSGWLLLFYLSYYFVGHYVTTKGIPLNPVLGIPFDLGTSVLFKYLLVIIFLVHIATSIKLNFFLRSQIATILLGTATIFLSLMVVFNF